MCNVEAAGLADAAALAEACGAGAGEWAQAATPPPSIAGTMSASAIERRRDLGFAVMELPWDQPW
jgi:hypothetical protein